MAIANVIADVLRTVDKRHAYEATTPRVVCKSGKHFRLLHAGRLAVYQYDKFTRVDDGSGISRDANSYRWPDKATLQAIEEIEEQELALRCQKQKLLASQWTEWKAITTDEVRAFMAQRPRVRER